MGADFVAVARGMLTDPHYAAKAISGRNGEIIRCIECKPCTYMRDSRCPDEAYPGYAPTAKKRVRSDDPVEEQPEGSSIS